MPLSEADFQVIRSWVGPRPTDGELRERYERLDSVDAVIEETLRSRLAQLSSHPSSFSTPEGLSVSTSENLRTLRQTLEDFTNQGGTSGGAAVTRIVRSWPR